MQQGYISIGIYQIVSIFILNESMVYTRGEGTPSADAHDIDAEQLAQLLQLVAHMPQPHGTVMRRSLCVPALNKLARADGKAIPAVRIPDLEGRPGLRLAFRNQQLEPAASVLNHGQQRHWTVLHAHLDRKPASYFAVIHLQRLHLDLALGDA